MPCPAYPARKGTGRAQHLEAAAQLRQPRGEGDHRLAFLGRGRFPVRPADLVILAIGIVVAVLVRPDSSPATIIGVPSEVSSVVIIDRITTPRAA
jgi:hypothetical protein